jgi:beta-galactosidase
MGRWHPEEWQAAVHEADWATIKSRPFVWGSFIWNMFDFTSFWRHEGDTAGLNDKGLVTSDRKIRKDAFYFYKANWSDEPVLYITSRRFTERTNAVTNVKVYSNLPNVTLLLNGNVVGRNVPNDECVMVWKNVRLASGENRVEVRAEDKKEQRELADQCLWILKR